MSTNVYLKCIRSFAYFNASDTSSCAVSMHHPSQVQASTVRRPRHTLDRNIKIRFGLFGQHNTWVKSFRRVRSWSIFIKYSPWACQRGHCIFSEVRSGEKPLKVALLYSETVLSKCPTYWTCSPLIVWEHFCFRTGEGWGEVLLSPVCRRGVLLQ